MEQDLAEKLGNFVLSAEEKQEIKLNEDDVFESTEECLRSLFGRIYGSKKANFTRLLNYLEKTWQPKQNFEMKEVGYNCFQFIFSSKSEIVQILESRINWSFENQYLLLKQWSEPDTIDKIETMDRVGMWVQLWNIPFHWLSIRTGRKIARLFPAIHDVVVSETGRFIRIRVDVSLDKPLIRGTIISMGGKSRWVDFKYEDLLGFCTYCGRVGYELSNCEVRINDLAQNNLQQGQFGEWIRAPEENDPKTKSRGRENGQESYEEVPETSGISNGERGLEQVAQVRNEVNKLAQQVSMMQDLVGCEIKVDEKELVVLAERLMRQLLNLDGIEAEEEGRARRRAEVRRVQRLMETVDELKSRNSNACCVARESFC